MSLVEPAETNKDTHALQQLQECVVVQAITITDSHVVNWAWSSTHEAMLVQAHEKVAQKQCDSCAKGSGPFLTCIVTEGFFSSSCASCHYSLEGSHCSLHGCEFP